MCGQNKCMAGRETMSRIPLRWAEGAFKQRASEGGHMQEPWIWGIADGRRSERGRPAALPGRNELNPATVEVSA